VTAVAVQAGLDAPSGDAVTIASSAYEVTADAVESDIGSITLGQPAAITIGATNEDLTGTVSSISPVAGDATNGVVSYAVTITFDTTPRDLRDGMSADVSITTASAPNVLTIPSAALRGGNGTYRVSVLDPSTGAPAQRDVTVGLVTNTLAEITGGLSEGETVITGTAADLQSTTTNGAGAFPGGGFGGGQFRGGFGNGGGNGGNGSRSGG
jgi:multidrug efflux pump subunit AcrA (membrane-fusion protein)